MIVFCLSTDFDPSCRRLLGQLLRLQTSARSGAGLAHLGALPINTPGLAIFAEVLAIEVGHLHASHVLPNEAPLARAAWSVLHVQLRTTDKPCIFTNYRRAKLNSVSTVLARRGPPATGKGSAGLTSCGHRYAGTRIYTAPSRPLPCQPCLLKTRLPSWRGSRVLNTQWEVLARRL